MSNLFATGGSKLYIGGALAYSGTDLSSSDFSGESWTQIKGVTNLGSAGDNAELITSAHIGSNRVRKIKGTRNAGSMQIMADLDYADAGQLALIAAEKARDSYAFKIEFNDAPSGGTPSERLFVAYVMSAVDEMGEANNATQLSATLEIDSNIVRVAAAGA
ncbi:phage tail tube protein [Cucumibacter marinus]|uniref:phage tail tube protein n=1 Tax=Cucumibacter marinus TaxID=1121252 RepID=UPI0003F6CBAB|nr:phage tail tube protein [Cucumibacter marinus]